MCSCGVTRQMRAGDEVGLMVGQEAQHGGEHLRLANARAQRIGIHTGKRQQPVRPRAIRQYPAQRQQRQQRGVLRIRSAAIRLAIRAVGSHDRAFWRGSGRGALHR